MRLSTCLSWKYPCMNSGFGLYIISLANLQPSIHGAASIIYSLNVDGSIIEPAVQPTYLPALLTQGLLTVRSKSKGERKKALQIMFQYLAHIMDIREKPTTPASVLERSILGIVNETIRIPKIRFWPSHSPEDRSATAKLQKFDMEASSLFGVACGAYTRSEPSKLSRTLGGKD